VHQTVTFSSFILRFFVFVGMADDDGNDEKDSTMVRFFFWKRFCFFLLSSECVGKSELTKYK